MVIVAPTLEYSTVPVDGVKVPEIVNGVPEPARVKVPDPPSKVSAWPDVPSMVMVSTCIEDAKVNLSFVAGAPASVLFTTTTPMFCAVALLSVYVPAVAPPKVRVPAPLVILAPEIIVIL